MNESQNKPRVAPPAAYKAPSLPTLAALGAISVAALASGCAKKTIMLGGALSIPEPEVMETQNVSENKTPKENVPNQRIAIPGSSMLAPVETQTPPAEKTQENIPEGGDVFIGEIPAQ